MLKKFLLNVLSSFVGTWIAVVVFAVAALLFIFGIIGNMALSSGLNTERVKSRSVLVIDLNGTVEEREMATEPDIVGLLQGNIEVPQTLDVLVQSIREASTNKDIVAVYLKGGSLAASPATLDALRHELIEFKKTTDGKKKIYAYADSYSQGSYFVASVADSIFMNPGGELNLKGLSSSGFYMKNLFDKLGVQFQVVKVGTYKSAVEPYILENMSEPARAQMDTLLGNMWNYIRSQIAESRPKITSEDIDSLINIDYISFAKSDLTVKAGLIDALVYERTIDKKFATLTGQEEKKINFVSPQTLVAQTPWGDQYGSKNQVAVLFACGEIQDGEDNQINYETLVPQIVELADDENVKALVLRVNSPGGSVFGSEQIGEALDYFKSKGKPFVVSMGDYAASGGYWISATADRIFADPLTVTGSIGIFGLLPNFKGTLDMFGVNVASVSTNPNAVFPSGFQPLNEEQMQVMQKYVDRGYEDFTSRVAKGRKMKKNDVLRIAEGRVWDARSALKIGLVDALGYLDDAIQWAAQKASIGSNYDVAAYPQIEPSFWSILQSNGGAFSEVKTIANIKNEDMIKAYLLRKILQRNYLQARMPEFRISL